MSPDRSLAHAPLPLVIQGGMGVGVSNWRLANAVARAGQLGVVSGTAVDTLVVRRLQDGDPDGSVRRAMARFPEPAVAAAVLDRWFRPGGLEPGTPYGLLPMYRRGASVAREQVTMLAAFVEVWLAREGHDGPVGMNLLTKVQLPNLAALYGAMLAGVDYVLMGAGIPREIPGALDALARHDVATMRLDVDERPGTAAEPEWITFDPRAHASAATIARPLCRPRFLAVISATSLAMTLARKATGTVDGFIVEGPTAGGHNAPPRGAMQLDERGQPVYGERDAVDLAKLRELGLPFWIAGGAGTPEALAAALADGAAGVQVGTLFAFCHESGITPALRDAALAEIADGTARVFTDPRASATGYPFKLLELTRTAQQDDGRERECDLGYLRSAYRREDGRIDYRCAAEPVAQWIAKGGTAESAEGRRCLCNGLIANVGHAQRRDGRVAELPLLTCGDDLESVRRVLAGRRGYSAAAVVEYLLAGSTAAA